MCRKAWPQVPLRMPPDDNDGSVGFQQKDRAWDDLTHQSKMTSETLSAPARSISLFRTKGRRKINNNNQWQEVSDKESS